VTREAQVRVRCSEEIRHDAGDKIIGRDALIVPVSEREEELEFLRRHPLQRVLATPARSFDGIACVARSSQRHRKGSPFVALLGSLHLTRRIVDDPALSSVWGHRSPSQIGQPSGHQRYLSTMSWTTAPSSSGQLRARSSRARSTRRRFRGGPVRPRQGRGLERRGEGPRGGDLARPRTARHCRPAAVSVARCTEATVRADRAGRDQRTPVSRGRSRSLENTVDGSASVVP
jgi:hypothetical protein